MTALEQSFMLTMQRGIYLPIPNLNNRSINRLVIATVGNANTTLSEDDEVKLHHEVIHLLRSYGENEFAFYDNTILAMSELIETEMPIEDSQINVTRSKKSNVQAEENFVDFLSKKSGLLVGNNFNDFKNMLEVLRERIQQAAIFDRLPSDAKDEMLRLYLDLSIIANIYNGNVANAVDSSQSNFHPLLVEKTGKENADKFMKTYNQPFFTDSSIIKQVDESLDISRFKKQ